VDIAVEEEVKQLIDHLKETMPPLAGIFHGAAVLDDGLLVDMDKDRFTRVMMPKIAGVLHLHKYSRDFPLDFFVNISSVSSIIGNPGQGNYVAANAFLDAFSHYRRALDLPATTINLGVLKEVGMVSRNENTERILEGSGVKGLTTQNVLRALELVIKKKPVQIGIFDVDWQKWSGTYAKSKDSSRFKKLFQDKLDNKKSGKDTGIIHQILNLEEKQRQQFLEKLVVNELSKVIKLEPGKIELDRSIKFLGIDSIMAAEFVRKLIQVLKIEISPVAFLSGPSVREVAALIGGKISPQKN
jgi:acyl carrier protein